MMMSRDKVDGSHILPIYICSLPLSLSLPHTHNLSPPNPPSLPNSLYTYLTYITSLYLHLPPSLFPSLPLYLHSPSLYLPTLPSIHPTPPLFLPTSNLPNFFPLSTYLSPSFSTFPISHNSLYLPLPLFLQPYLSLYLSLYVSLIPSLSLYPSHATSLNLCLPPSLYTSLYLSSLTIPPKSGRII